MLDSEWRLIMPLPSRCLLRVQGSHTRKSLNFKIKIQGLYSPWKLQSVLESPWNLLPILSNEASQVSETKIGALSTLSICCGIILAWFCPSWSPWKMEECVLERPWKVLEFLVEKKSTNPESRKMVEHRFSQKRATAKLWSGCSWRFLPH